MQRTKNKAAWNDVGDRLRQLLVAGLSGDEKQYLSFLKKLSEYLRRFFARRLTHFPGDVEDLVQETLLAVHNQRHTYDMDIPLTAWVHAIAKYKFVDFLRARGRQAAMTDPLDENDSIFSESHQIEALEARIDVRKLLEQLPDRYKLPILHIKLQGLSVAETARLTGMSESAVKVGVHRGIKALATKISDPI
ncbi:MAG: sigma-70 family RNA polymerase sigma factor [Betaproteobacteria bacterium]|nr:sigma-70 family RNA polymerase sigma factor [Betaproteobacteria bacterium]